MVTADDDKIFAPVSTVQEAIAIVTSFTEDDLIKYERECRAQLIRELETMCLEFGLVLPLWLMHASTRSDIYDAQARMREITQRTALEMVNDDFGYEFSSMGQFRKWMTNYSASNL